MFLDKLLAATRRNDSLLCVGLDVDVDKLPAGLPRDAEGAYRFAAAIVEATADLVCCYKPNIAFWEAMGPAGVEALARLRRAMPADIPVLIDAKRGDMANSAEYYAAALFDRYGFDAATVSPYQGADALEPYLRRPAHTAFVLCKTSNPGSADLQDLPVPAPGGGTRPLYVHVAELVNRLNERYGTGALVVGATYPGQLAEIRRVAPALPILIPGVGTQGGDVEGAVRHGGDARGERAIISVSRAVIYASSGPDWIEAARRAAAAYRGQFNAHRPGAPVGS